VALRDGGIVYDGAPAGADSESLVQRGDGFGSEQADPGDSTGPDDGEPTVGHKE
jgi:hypothetical protein